MRQLMFLVAFGVALSGCQRTIDATDYEHTRDYARYSLSIDNGNVIVNPSLDRGQTRAVAQYVGVSVPAVRVEVLQEVLEIEGECGDRSDCLVDFFVDLLPATDGSLLVGEGTVQLKEMAGDTTVDIEVGTLDATDLESRLFIATVGGAIDVDFATTPATVELESTEGDVTLTVPAGAYRVDASASGSLSIEGITEDPTADASLRVEARGGDVVIEGV